MDEVEAVAAVIKALNVARIPHMIVGSLSSNAYGIPRSTEDADIVIELGSYPLGKLLDHLPNGFRLEPQIGFETLTSTTRYRLHCDLLALPFTIELFETSDDPHDKLRFERRVSSSYGGVNTFLPRAEDVVIMKLRWFARSKERRRDIDDASNVLAVQQGKLDLNYIRQWCTEHGTLVLLDETLASIPKLPSAS